MIFWKGSNEINKKNHPNESDTRTIFLKKKTKTDLKAEFQYEF